ncbi:gastrula zinc finger protein xLCGF3.1-like isoform X21 [Bacillus rossius redtenbacheri]|uniref:gastrula zinc finger protein xLCGF3.1-like isoform X21 n=1 Tax=Bacillus rossius redtenbacheri TaxID=93214 RepID=UPI002FDD9C4D
MRLAANEDLMVKQEPSEIVFPLIKEESVNEQCEDSWQPEPGSSSASQDYTLCKQQVKEEITIEEHPIAAATADVWNEPHSCVGYHGNTSSGCMGHRSQDSQDTCILIKPEVTNTDPVKLSCPTNCHPKFTEKYCFSNCIPIQQHTNTHTAHKRFSCQTCSAKFSKSSHLKQHSLTHTGEKPFSCTVCSAKFSQASHLKQHSLTHTREKPFTCTVCSAKFRQASHLNKHSLTHTGEKPISCTVCSAKFSQASHLKQHSLTHTREKPFPCTVCTAKFSRASHLKRHSLTHTREKPFSLYCMYC